MIQWRQCLFHRCVVKTIFPIICNLTRSLRSFRKIQLPLICVGRDPPVVSLTWQYPYESDSIGKRTCLDTGFLVAKWNLPCCYPLFSHFLDQLSLCKYLYAKWGCQCWCCLCLAVTGWCHFVRWQRSYFRGALSKDSRRTGKCRSAHCTQHR